MISRLKNRWLRPRALGILLAKLILSSATDLAAQTLIHQNITPEAVHVESAAMGQSSLPSGVR